MEHINSYSVLNYVINTNNDHIAKSYATGKPYEWPLLEYIKSLKLTGVAIDVGAHQGNHSIYFSKQCLFSRIYAFEAFKPHYDILLHNIAENAVKNVLAYNMAASNERCLYDMQTEGKEIENNGSYRVVKKVCGKSWGNTIDSILFYETECVSLIKFDVEGHEIQAIRGAQETITLHRPVVFAEAHVLSPIKTEMKSFGYHLHKLHKLGSPMAEFRI
jgi:FkbM family methyltransferase